jgi:hypothetical protein
VKIPCPQCGGEVPLRETSGFVDCSFCGASLVLDPTGIRPHLVYRSRHGPGSVLPLLRRWCDAEGLPEPSLLAPPTLTYYPFWRFGVVGRPRLVPAWPTLQPRWSSLSAPDAEQAIYDPGAVGKARVVEPTVAEAAARSRSARGESVPAGDLVHLPFYEVTVRVGGARLHVILDACSGRAYPDQQPAGAPGASPGGSFMRAMAIAGWLAMFLEAMIIPQVWLAALLVAVSGVVVSGLVAARLRSGDG